MAEQDDAPPANGPEAAVPATEDLNWIERNSKTITTIATASIPIVLAAFSLVANSAINDKNLSKEYVNLAIGILQKDIEQQGCQDGVGTGAGGGGAEATETTVSRLGVDECKSLTDDQALRQFAVELLNTNTQFGLDDAAADALILGKVSVSPVLAAETMESPPVSEIQEVSATEQSETGKDVLTNLTLFESLEERQSAVESCAVVLREDLVDVRSDVVSEGEYDVTRVRDDGRIRFFQLANSVWIRVDESVSVLEGCPSLVDVSE